MEIELSIALPIWNSKTIAWLAMEGLCRQNTNFKWELLIAEEQIEEFGINEVRKYADRLKAAGCVSFKYFPLTHRISLPQKWKFLASKINENSKGFLLQAADCYPEPLRLQRTFDMLNEGYDWVQNRRGYFYSHHYKNCIEFDQKSFGPGCKTGLNMAISTKLLNRIPDSFQTSGIDSFLFKHTAPENICWIEGEVNGVDVDGLNNISFSRRHNFYRPAAPFNATDKKLHEIVPNDIAELLLNL